MQQDAVIPAKAGTHLPLPFAFSFLNDKGENESKLGSSFRWNDGFDGCSRSAPGKNANPANALHR